MSDASVQDTLARLKSLDTSCPTWVADFEAGLFSLPSDIRPFFAGVLDLFDDEAPYDEAMYSVIHLIERVEIKTYVGQILMALPVFVRQAPRWASIVVMRILNTPEARSEMARQVGQSSADIREAVAWLLGAINKRDAAFEAQTRPVLDALGAS
ncbi:MAG: Imm30 family immunity protein [Pseudomonadota bacterium]